MTEAPADPIVAMQRIRKSFGPVEVLHGVDFDILPGEVHVLAGENGAGKSTLIKILSGVYDDFAGTLTVDGQPRRFAHPKEAVRAGIATIHQELSLVPSMTVSDNLFLGRELAQRFGMVNFSLQESHTTRLLEGLELGFSPRALVEELPISSQQLLEIARALARDATVLVLDEPTSALNDHEVGFLFERILELRRRGRGIVYITHRIEEIYRLADRITVLRDGSLVGTSPAGDLPQKKLLKWMVGRDVHVERGGAPDSAPPPPPPPPAPPAPSAPSAPLALQVDNLRVAHADVKGHFVVNGVSFSLTQGEVLGLAGLQGSGTSEVLHALFGALGHRAVGEVHLGGERFPIRGPRESVQRGLVLLTNDRKALGLAPDLPVTHNATLASLSRFCNVAGWMRQEEERVAVHDLTRGFQLSAPSLDAPVRILSGGNQQKVYLARCLLARPRVLLLDEPTRGVDVGAKADIYRLMRRWVAEDISILLITSEMDELLALSDRILVMHRGQIAAEFTRETASKDDILAAAMGESGQAQGRGVP